MRKIQTKLSADRLSSSFEKYTLAVTGTTEFSNLIIHEFLLLCISPLPGWLGNFLRQRLFPKIFGKIGHNCRFGPNCTIRNPSKITIGNDVEVSEKITLDVRIDGEGIRIGNRVRIGTKTILISSASDLSIGADTQIGKLCRIGALRQVVIGSHCLIGDEVCFIAAGHPVHDTSLPIIEQPLTCRGSTTVGNNVRIENRVSILDGVSIGDRATILANSFVNRDVVAGSTVAGTPATLVQEEV